MPTVGRSPQRVSTPPKTVTGMLSLDTETTGKDFHHGTKPFFVTMWDGGEEDPDYWEWFVDPITRQPEIPEEDIRKISSIIEMQGNWGNGFSDDIAERHVLILQNPKFDAEALATIGITKFPWKQVRDTLTAGHLLSSNTAHNLTDMACEMTGVDIQPLEDELEKHVKECRSICRSKFPEWRIAKDGYDDMPSVKKSTGKDKEDKSWRADMWLPRLLARELGLAADHPWWTCTANYSNADSMGTFVLWVKMKERLIERGLWNIFKTRMKLPEITSRIKARGVTCSKASVDHIAKTYLEEAYESGEICKNIAKSYGYDLMMPKGAAVNKSLTDFIFNKLNLEKTFKENAKTENPTLDKGALAHYLHTLEKDTKEHLFIESLLAKRAREKALTDLSGYRRFWLPLGIYNEKGEQLWYCLHPELNHCGSDTLRWSCRNPNAQNIKKPDKTEVDEMSMRAVFSPLPGREWWSLDGKNLERRIPAYKAKETDIILLLERPDDPPYFGSEHLMVAHLIFPKEFNSCINEYGQLDGRIFKKHFEPLYKRTKNGNFAIQYNAGRLKADRTFGVTGAYDMIKSRFHKQEALNQQCIKFAEKHGYVETIPDKTVDPKRGYPINCVREYGKIKPTLPFNYHVQGTACWWMQMCMIRVEEKLEQWRSRGFDGWMILQIHDELVFDFPKASHPKTDPENSNLWRVQELQRLMEVNGENLVIPIPTPVSIEYHEHNWAVGETCA